MSIANKPTVVIVAIASRPYVQAAVAAGFEVIAIDCFADVDTKRLAREVFQVPMQNGCLDHQQVLAVVNSIDPQTVEGLCYGAGFEVQPAVLTELSHIIDVIGNTGDVVDYCKNPMRFFALCDVLEVAYPETMFVMPKSEKGWLQKSIGGSGGSHIKLTNHNGALESGCYYQKRHAGESVACLFLAGPDGVQVLGFHEQWVDQSMMEPYRYGGAASNVQLSDLAKARFIAYVGKLSQAIGLVGLNSCDVICDGDDIYVLEINPRLSASVDLYGTEYPDLLALHINACRNDEAKGLVSIANENISHAHQVVYANSDVVIDASIAWPTWVVDIPKEGSHIKASMPVCTVLATEDSVRKVKKLVQERVATINQQFLN